MEKSSSAVLWTKQSKFGILITNGVSTPYMDINRINTLISRFVIVLRSECAIEIVTLKK